MHVYRFLKDLNQWLKHSYDLLHMNEAQWADRESATGGKEHLLLEEEGLRKHAGTTLVLEGKSLAVQQHTELYAASHDGGTLRREE